MGSSGRVSRCHRNHCVTCSKSLPPPSFTPLVSTMGAWVEGGDKVPFQPGHLVPVLFQEPERKGGEEWVTPRGGNRRDGLVGSRVLQLRGKESVEVRAVEGWG